jgi:DNA-binding response OmpR family regulator
MQKEKILIVDDEQINLDFFEVMLSKLGFTVEKAEDDERALQKVKECNPDLIILDNIMPRLSGWEVTKILKNDSEYAEYSNIPVVMFSAMDDVKDKIEGFELGVEDYITKPFNFSEVLARIKAVLRGRDLTKQILHREKRIALTESLNKSLLYFTNHVKKPTSELLEMAEKIDVSDADAVKKFVESVVAETKETLATIKGLEEKVEDLQAEGDRLKEDEVSLDSLEMKYQKHFNSYKAKNVNI